MSRELRIIVRLWTKFAVIGILLILSLSGTVYAARAALGAVHSFTVQQTLSKNGDVRTLRPWMTINYISHMCLVPTNYLDDSLGVARGDTHFNRATLHEIATYAKQSDTQIVYHTQKAVLNYRHHKPADKPGYIISSTARHTTAKPASTAKPTATPKSQKTTVKPKPTSTPKSKKTTGRKAQKT